MFYTEKGPPFFCVAPQNIDNSQSPDFYWNLQTFGLPTPDFQCFKVERSEIDKTINVSCVFLFCEQFLPGGSIDRPRGLVSVGLGTRIVRRSSGTVELQKPETVDWSGYCSQNKSTRCRSSLWVVMYFEKFRPVKQQDNDCLFSNVSVCSFWFGRDRTKTEVHCSQGSIHPIETADFCTVLYLELPVYF